MLTLNDLMLLVRLADALQRHQGKQGIDWTQLLIERTDDVLRLVALVCERPNTDVAEMKLDEAIVALNERMPLFIEQLGAYLAEKVMPGIGQLNTVISQLTATAEQVKPKS